MSRPDGAKTAREEQTLGIAKAVTGNRYTGELMKVPKKKARLAGEHFTHRSIWNAVEYLEKRGARERVRIGVCHTCRDALHLHRP